MNQKKLQIKEWFGPGKQPTLNPNVRNITVFNQTEGYYIHVANCNTMKDDHPERETSLIEIKMRNGKTWKGGINDLEAIFAICNNALSVFMSDSRLIADNSDLVKELLNMESNYR